jgi:hypothetical protein
MIVQRTDKQAGGFAMRSRTGYWGLVFALAVAGMGAPVAAAPLSGNDVRVALDKGIRCLMEQDPRRAERFLSFNPLTKDAQRVATYISKSECMISQTGAVDIDYAPAILRGALYRQIYLRDYGDAATAVGPNRLNFVSETAGAAPADAEKYRAEREYAYCVTKANPTQARSLVLAEPQSDAELTAFYYLKPTLDGCRTRPADADLSRATISGLVAETLYRLAQANGKAGGGA